jgi:CheY-like chemotaxis protein
MSSGSATIDQLEQEMEAEFLEETRDVLNGLEVMLGNFESGLVKADVALKTLRKTFMSMDARSQSVGNVSMSILTHRGCEYLSDLDELTRPGVPDIQVFIDVIRKLLDGGADGEGTAELVRQLPFRRIADFDITEAMKQQNVEVLLVIPDRATGRYVERELAACGYRVSNARGFFKGLEMAVRTQPNMVIAAAMLDEASGIDMARALAGIDITAKMPFALLTSFDAGHPSLAGLPPTVAVIKKGSDFGEGIADALAQFKIT